MLTKEQIWLDIQQIMQEDYAGCIDKRNVNRPEQYTITNEMSDQRFEETVQDYLLDFKDGHLSFWMEATEIPNIGFSVRRYEDELYVTQCTEEKRLKARDKIIRIDGKKIPELAAAYNKRLEDEVPERQRWANVLVQAKSIQVERDHERFDLTLSDYERMPKEPIYAFKQLNETTAYLQLTDFLREAPIRELIEENKMNVEQSDNLIIDVRVNGGGNDTFYFPLLPYIFDKTMSLVEMSAEDERMYTNYTERNCDLWVEAMEEYLEQELDPETVAMIQQEIGKTEANRGRGFVQETEGLDLTIPGKSMPQCVYVLSDWTCGSSGDTFVANAKKSPKVTVVGRPTMGIIDYFNVVIVEYGKYKFMYSISKVNEKYFVNETGVLPDVYIPWTPEHLEEDKDLAWVMEDIEKRSKKLLA